MCKILMAAITLIGMGCSNNSNPVDLDAPNDSDVISYVKSCVKENTSSSSSSSHYVYYCGATAQSFASPICSENTPDSALWAFTAKTDTNDKSSDKVIKCLRNKSSGFSCRRIDYDSDNAFHEAFFQVTDTSDWLASGKVFECGLDNCKYGIYIIGDKAASWNENSKGTFIDKNLPVGQCTAPLPPLDVQNDMQDCANSHGAKSDGATTYVLVCKQNGTTPCGSDKDGYYVIGTKADTKPDGSDIDKCLTGKTSTYSTSCEFEEYDSGNNFHKAFFSGSATDNPANYNCSDKTGGPKDCSDYFWVYPTKVDKSALGTCAKGTYTLTGSHKVDGKAVSSCWNDSGKC